MNSLLFVIDRKIIKGNRNLLRLKILKSKLFFIEKIVKFFLNTLFLKKKHLLKINILKCYSVLNIENSSQNIFNLK
jgi:hypothetical protein